MDRSDTTCQIVFQLPEPDSVTFDFSQPDYIHVTVPPDSTWSMPLHWHHNHDSRHCASVRCTGGSLHVFTAKRTGGSSDLLGSTGTQQRFEASQLNAWGRDGDGKAHPALLSVDLEAPATLHRNVCSAVLDHELFPRLASTPPWVRGLFALLAPLPAAQERLLACLLWVQLRTMFYTHGFHLYCGRISISWWWMAQPFGGTVPQWAKNFEWRSQEIMSIIVLASCYWVGTLLLGMKAEYRQYTPERKEESEISVKKPDTGEMACS